MRKSAVVLVALVAAVMAPAAFAENGSFETGDFSGWARGRAEWRRGRDAGGAPGGGSYFGGVTAGSQDAWQSISTTRLAPGGRRGGRGGALLQRRGPRRVLLRRCRRGRRHAGRQRRGTIFTANSCASGFSGLGPWGGGQVYVTQDGVYTVVARVKNIGDSSVSSGVGDRRCRCSHAAGGVLRRRRQHRRGRGEAHGRLVPQPPGRPAGQGSELRRCHTRAVRRGQGPDVDSPPTGYVQKALAGDAQHVPDGLYAYFTAA